MKNKKLKQPIKWHGGKSYLARWVIEHFPPRESYTHYLEPFAGGLSVLFEHNPEGKSESVNDINSQLANFWQVLRAPDLFGQFAHQVSLCEFSDKQFKEAKTC